MRKRLIFTVALAFALLLILTSCQWFNTEAPHECESLCLYCKKCADLSCAEEVCLEKCEGHFVPPPHAAIISVRLSLRGCKLLLYG